MLELINIFDEATRAAATTESLTSVDPSLQLSGYVGCIVLYFIAVYYIISYHTFHRNIAHCTKVIPINLHLQYLTYSLFYASLHATL